MAQLNPSAFAQLQRPGAGENMPKDAKFWGEYWLCVGRFEALASYWNQFRNISLFQWWCQWGWRYLRSSKFGWMAWNTSKSP